MENVRQAHLITDSIFVKTSLLVRGFAVLLLVFIIPLESILQNYIKDYGGDMVYEIQTKRTHGADQFFKLVSFLGDTIMFIIIFPALFNLYDTRRAVKVIIMISFSMFVLSCLNLLYQEPRPY